MYVVGATQGRMFEDIRKIVPNHFYWFRESVHKEAHSKKYASTE